MEDFQSTLKRILFKEADEMTPIGAPEKFNIGHHDTHMDKSGAGGSGGEVLRQHLEAQAFEFKKLKDAYVELVQAVNAMFTSFNKFGIEDKGFMKGKMTPMAIPPHLQQGQPSAASTGQAMAGPGAADPAVAGKSDFRQRMQRPVTANLDDL